MGRRVSWYGGGCPLLSLLDGRKLPQPAVFGAEPWPKKWELVRVFGAQQI